MPTIDPYWIRTDDVGDGSELARFDGVWLVPGSPNASFEGMLTAAHVARTAGVPVLGTCGGFQHALIEIARNVAGLHGATHAEYNGDIEKALIVPLECALLGEEAEVDVMAGTRAAEILGAGPRTERFFCSYGVDDGYRRRLEQAGVVFSGSDPTGAIRLFELPALPFFVCSLFQPELASDPTMIHPLITAFTDAAARRAAISPTTASTHGS
jgi:CTP synthase (UTP-ammonia lyase)